MPKNDFQETFTQLKAIFKPYAAKLQVVHDTDINYYLDTHLVMKNKHRLCFGGVRAGKAYVSFHLMPLYASAALQKSTQALIRETPIRSRIECSSASGPQLGGFGFQCGDLLLELFDLARLVVLALGARELLPQEQHFMLDDFQPLFSPAVHLPFSSLPH